MVKVTAVKHKGFRDFSFACRTLAEITGNDMATVIDSEVGQILQATVAKTTVATHGKVVKDHYGQIVGQYDGKLVFLKPPQLRKKYIKSGKGTGKEWGPLTQDIRARRQASLMEKLKRRGLGAAAWLEQARILGISIKVPSQVSSAKASRPFNVKAMRKGAADTYTVQGQNFEQVSTKHAGGDKALRAAVTARVRVFVSAMKQWAKGRVGAVAKKYPDLLSVS
jgi:hypothetical protein